ncbi:MAG: hypothetical protein ACRDP6_38325 [Actinoallomurus sp.]
MTTTAIIVLAALVAILLRALSDQRGRLNVLEGRMEFRTEVAERESKARRALDWRLAAVEDKASISQAALQKHDRAAGGFWKTKDGTVLRVRDMSDSHLENTIKYVEGMASAANAYRLLTREQERRRADVQFSVNLNKKVSSNYAIADLSKRLDRHCEVEIEEREKMRERVREFDALLNTAMTKVSKKAKRAKRGKK